MAIYIILIIYILALPFIVDRFTKDEEKKRNAIAFWGMLAIFLVLALKGDVGSDISGYCQQYKISANRAWSDVDYVYFESGYITLTKIFSKSGIDFQWFMAFVYALACSSMYLFIKKYSKNPTLSLIIFVCYEFFVFYISGVRQTIAMSLCLLAFMAMKKRKIIWYIIAFLITALATTIHQSAIVFFVVLPIIFIRSKKINIMNYILILFGSVVFRPLVWTVIDKFFRSVDVNTSISLGGNFVFLVGISLFMYFINSEKNVLKINIEQTNASDIDAENNVLFTRILLLSPAALILFSGHSLARAAMYMIIFIIPGLPNTVYKLESRFKLLCEFALVVFFIALFYFETLSPNQLDLCPYEFFWQ